MKLAHQTDHNAGTGKTTVVIRILEKLLHNANDEAKILMTASTHNGKCESPSLSDSCSLVL